MAIQMVPMYCPNCGAQFDADKDREFMFCQYCGTKIMIHNTNTYTLNYNETKRTIDDAEIKRTELEYELQKMKEEHKREKLEAIVLIPFAILVFLAYVLLFKYTR